MINIISIFIGGGCGAVIRYLIGLAFLKSFHVSFPLATLFVNLLGGFIIGFLYVLFIDKVEINTDLKLALTVGFCGGLTTFSTFSLEMFEMVGNHQLVHAFTYAFISVMLCLIAVAIGAHCAKYI